MAEDKVKLRQVFDSFDSDKSGFIELNELKKVSEELGSPIPEDQLYKIIRKLDMNEDGKISFEQFEFWWTNGHKGELGKLVFWKSKAMQMTKELNQKLKESEVNIEELADSKDIDKIQVDIMFGEQINEGIGISANIHQKGNQAIMAINKLKEQIPWLNKDSFNFILILKSSQPEEAKTKLISMLNEFIAMEYMPFKVQSIEQNDLINFKIQPVQEGIAIHIELKSALTQLIEQPVKQFDTINEKAGEDSHLNIQCQLKTNFSINDLLNEQNIIQTVLQGLSFNVKVQIPHKLNMKSRQIAEATQDGRANPFGLFLKLLLNKGKFKLKLKSPKMIQKFYEKLGIKELLSDSPSLSELLSQVAMFPEITQAKLNTTDPLHLLYKVAKYAKEYMEEKVKIVAQRKDFIVQIEIRCPNASKVYQTVFNEF